MEGLYNKPEMITEEIWETLPDGSVRKAPRNFFIVYKTTDKKSFMSKQNAIVWQKSLNDTHEKLTA